MLFLSEGASSWRRVHLQRKVAEAMSTWDDSVAIRIMLPDRQAPMRLGKEDGFQCAIAFLAHARGHLDRLDTLFARYQIEQRGCNEFRGRLRENWLSQPVNKRRMSSQGTLSAISELLAAESLESCGFTIVDLAAWNVGSPDIVCSHRGETICFEVKLFTESPEIDQLRFDSATGDGVAVSSVSRTPMVLNYIYSRLAEAVNQHQIDDSKGRSGVYFVFDDFATKPRDDFLASIDEGFSWYMDSAGEYPSIPESVRDIAVSRDPQNWIDLARPLYIGTYFAGFAPVQVQYKRQ